MCVYMYSRLLVPNYTRAVQKNAYADIVRTNTTCIKDKHEGCIHDFHTLKMEAVGFSETG
jgi:hypothetical protein